MRLDYFAKADGESEPRAEIPSVAERENVAVVGAIGFESTCKPKFNNIEISGWHLAQCFPWNSVVTAGERQVQLRITVVETDAR